MMASTMFSRTTCLSLSGMTMRFAVSSLWSGRDCEQSVRYRVNTKTKLVKPS